jgi:hypothetical protein
MNDDEAVTEDPCLEEMPTEEAVSLLVNVYGEGEATARWMVALAKGEIDGDVRAVADRRARRSSGQTRQRSVPASAARPRDSHGVG